MGPPQSSQSALSGVIGPQNEQNEQKRPQEGENQYNPLKSIDKPGFWANLTVRG